MPRFLTHEARSYIARRVSFGAKPSDYGQPVMVVLVAAQFSVLIKCGFYSTICSERCLDMDTLDSHVKLDVCTTNFFSLMWCRNAGFTFLQCSFVQRIDMLAL